MKETDVVRSLAALAQEVRLRVFRVLVVAGNDGLTPGDMAEFTACCRHLASNPARMELVPITVIGLPCLSGMKPVAVSVAMMWGLEVSSEDDISFFQNVK